MKKELDTTLFSLNPIPTWIYNHETFEILKVNAAAIDFYGFSKEEFLKLNFQDLCIPEEFQNLIDAHSDIKNRDGNINFGVFTQQKKNGTLQKREVKGHKVHFNNRTCILAVCNPLKTKSEEKHQSLQNEELLKSFIEESFDLVGIVNKDGNYTYLSPSSKLFSKINPKEYIGKNAFEDIHPEDAGHANTSLKKASTQESEDMAPYRAKNKANQWRWFETVLTNKLNDIKINGIVIITKDITDKIEEQRKAQLTQKKFETLIEKSSDCTVILSPEGQVTFVSKSIETVLGYTPQESMSLDLWTLIHPEDIEGSKSVLKKTLENPGISIKGYTSRFKHKNGSWRWLEPIVTNLIHDPSIGGIVDNFRDITEQIEEKHKLKLLESVITHTNDAVLITEAEPFDKPGPKIIYVNEAFSKMTGYKAEEVIGKTPRILQGPDSNFEELSKLGQAIRNWESYEVTTINYKKNGDQFWINFTVTPVADKNGHYTHWIAIERDVTEQKNKERKNELFAEISLAFGAENNINESTKNLCKTLGEFGEFDWVEVWTSSFNYSEMQLLTHYVANPEDEKFYNYSPDLNAIEISEGLAGRVWKAKKQLIWNHNDINQKFLRKDAANKIGLKAILGLPLLLNDEVVGVIKIGTKNDTDYLENYSSIFQKLEGFIGSELKRKKLKNDLHHLFDVIPDIICVLDFQGNFLRINKAGSKLLNYDTSHILNKTLDDFVHPADKGAFTDKIQNFSNDEKLFSLDGRFITKSGKVVWLSWYCTSFEEEGLVYASAKDITEEKNLQELNRQVNRLANIGSWEVDLIKQTVFWSKEVHEMHATDPLSYTPNLEDGINFYRSDFREMVKSHVEKAITNGITWNFEAVIVTANDNELWVKSIGNAEFQNGECVRLYGGFQDIHQKKLDALALEKSLKDLQDYKFSLDQSAIIAFTDKKGVITHTNANFCKISGFSSEELIGQTHKLINSGYHPKEFFVDLWQTITSGKVFRAEIKNKAKDGSYYWVDSTIVPFLNEKNKPIQFLAIRFDITERKKAEEEKNRFQKTLENSLNEIYMFDSETLDFSFVNKGAMLNLGYTEQEIKSLKPIDIKPEYSQSTFSKVIAPLKNHKEEKIVFFTNHQRKDGSLYPVEVHLQLVEESGNKNFIAIALDITERVKAEQDILEAKDKIEASEFKFKSYTEKSPIAIYTTDVNGDCNYVNETWLRMTGMSQKEALGKGWLNALHPDDLESINDKWYRSVKSGGNWRFEYRFINKESKEITWLEGTRKELLNEKNELLGFLGTNVNITERKKAERDLISTSDRLRLATSAAKMGIWDWDVVNDKLIWDERMYELYGVNKKEFTGAFSAWQNGLHPDDVERATKEIYDGVKGISDFDTEFRVVWPDKSIRYIEGYAIVSRDEEGRALRMIGCNMDITERRKVEEDILLANERFEKVTEATNDAIWDWDIVNDKFYRSDAIERFFGKKTRKRLTSKDFWKDRFHKNDRAEIQKSIEEAIANPSTTKWKMDYKILNEDGETLYVIDQGLIIRNEKGEAQRMVGAMTDITELKKSEKEIKFKANLLKTIGQAAISTDLNGVVNYWNHAAETIYGWTREEAIGINILDLTPSLGFRNQANQIMEVLRKGQSWQGEFQVRKKDGTRFPVRISNSPVYDEDNNLSGMLGISSDITQEKESQKLIKQYMQKLERSNEELEQFAFVASHDLQEPLRMVASFMDLLKRKYGHKIDEKGHQYIYYATDGAKRMKNIILDLLNYSRAGKVTELKEQIDINNILFEFKQLRRKIISEKNAKLVFDNLPIIHSYKAPITQIFHCLLDNALNYNKEDIPPLIKINFDENEKDYLFLIHDNGIGINPKFHDKVFMIFQSLHNDKKNSGTGIGLSIAKRQVEFLGGKIWFESEEGEGSIFYVQIPKTNSYE